MKPPKLQRWLDLLTALLARRYPATFEELIRDVPAYAAGDQSDETRRRMFERDKDELRAFGIPIETLPPPDEGEVPGYQLRVRDFYLPYLALRSDGETRLPRKTDKYGYTSLPVLTFDADELSAIAEAAARLRELGDPVLAEHAESAMRKLACDLPVDTAAHPDARLAPAQARAAPELFVAAGDALARRKRLTFSYHTMGSGTTAARTVEPFGLFFLNQHWYLAARAVGEETVKNYRLSRVAERQAQRPAPRHAGLRDPRRLRSPGPCPLAPGLGARHRGRDHGGGSPAEHFRRGGRRAPAG